MSGQYDAKQIIETEENQDNTPLDIDYHTAIDGERVVMLMGILKQ